MVIDKIGNINNIVEPKKSKKVTNAENISKNDSIEISTEGKKAAEVSKFINAVRETPDVRIERIKEIKERIDAGTYDFDDNKMLGMVADRIANFLLKK